MGILRFVDAAFPMRNYPSADGFCFYIGGDTPHIWSGSEVATLRQHYKYLLPIYVRSNPPGPGAAADVDAAVNQLKALGVPQGSLVAWDMEMTADAAYIGGVYGALSAAGYILIVYGSQSSVFGNRNPDGLYWGADWTNVPHLYAGDVDTQYVSFSGYDESLAQSTLPFWGAPPDPNPLLRQGASGPAVTLLQQRLNAWGAKIATDGSFGPATETAVKAFQTAHKLTVDGVVGPATWAALNAAPPPPGPQPYPAPTGLTVSGAAVTAHWDPVTVAGNPVTSYTVQAVQMNGTVAVHQTSPVNSARLSGLVHGWTYELRVWANGGPVSPPHAAFKITV